jgi:hypothetical protein
MFYKLKVLFFRLPIFRWISKSVCALKRPTKRQHQLVIYTTFRIYQSDSCRKEEVSDQGNYEKSPNPIGLEKSVPAMASDEALEAAWKDHDAMFFGFLLTCGIAMCFASGLCSLFL